MLLCVVGLSGSTAQIRATTEPLPHDAYIWQRLWTPALIASAHESADLVRSWRVLLAEADRAGRWTKVTLPWREVGATGRPVVGVIRIDGRLEEERVPALLERIAATIDGAPLAGLEIDYDCPTSMLAAYADFLAELRRRLPATLPLSITALPTWMNSPRLEALAPPLAELVLQVHAVDDPRRGLFDPEQAERWVREFGRRIGRPFRVALPAYDVRVTWRGDGRLAAVEGEMPLLVGPGESERLIAAPRQVRRFLDAMATGAPANLAGIAWFRLPTAADRHAWSARTWRAVIAGDSLPPARIAAELVATTTPGLWTVTLANEGPVDAPLPREVTLDAACVIGDGANGYRLVAEPDRPPVLRMTVGGMLRADDKRIIGWTRCAPSRRQLDVAG